MTTLPQPTDRQAAALERFLEDARRHGVEVQRHQLEVTYREEVRPGRGHDLFVFASDGERMATAYLDVYGNGSATSIHEVTVLCHPDSDPNPCDRPECHDDEDQDR